jgi:uncharacterized membrane protein
MEFEQRERKMSPMARSFIVGMQGAVTTLARHWLFFINGFWALLVVGAFVAPVLLAAGMEGPGHVFYTIYSFTCHQLPERSFFLFGSGGLMATYDQAQIVRAGADPSNLLTLRQFVGNPELGWKLGFSDRMVTMYGGAFLGGLIFWLLSRRRRMRPIPVWLLVLMVLPMAIDGTSHLVSEISGLGFRDTNTWAMPIFGAQPGEFYTGTALGTLNSHLRLWTGLLFGIGMMLFAYPLMALGFDDLAEEAQRTLGHNRARIATES